MLKTVGLLNNLTRYPIKRVFNLKVNNPINLTVGLTYRCNAHCFSCRIYDKPKEDELKAYEWAKIFKNIGDSVYWVTLTGGEPFLYRDIVEVVYYLIENCHPAIINIPTNGQMASRIEDGIWQICKLSPETKITVNVSLDHYDPNRNDEIRGVKGYYHNALDTIRSLQALKVPNLTVGIHSVISKANVKDIKEIVDWLSLLPKDKSHFITEIAEQRVELGTVGLSITPELDEYKDAVSVLKELSLSQPKTIIRSFRQDYYNKVISYMENGSHIPCYAGYASCQITPDAEVVPCCIMYQSMGNLRLYEYDFNALWNSPTAKIIRTVVKGCKGCQLANVSYTNSLLHVPTMIKVFRGVIQ
jgi:MoaA/NifB/PqqE/SkfB family radical SAM enzyme